MNEGQVPDKRKAERDLLQSKVEFYVDADIIEAVSVDVSDIGVRFETEKPIMVRLRMEVGEQLLEREARLVWAVKKSDSDMMTYGLEYIPNAEENI